MADTTKFRGNVNVTGSYQVNGVPTSPLIKGAAQADSTATDVEGIKTDFNALLAKLRTAGVIASS